MGAAFARKVGVLIRSDVVLTRSDLGVKLSRLTDGSTLARETRVGETAMADGLSFTTEPIYQNTTYYYSGRIESDGFNDTVVVGNSTTKKSTPLDFSKGHSYAKVLYNKEDMAGLEGRIDSIFFYVGIEVGIPNTANVYYSGLDWVGPAIAGTMIGGYWLSMLIGRLIGASLGSKISSKTMLGVMSAVAIVLVICAIFTPETVHIKIGANTIPLSLGFLVLCGLCTSIMWGAIFNLAVEGLGKYTAAASGIFMTLVCGGGIIPFFQNLLADHVGSLQSYWLIIACLAFLVYYAFAGSKNVNTDIKVD